MTQQESVRTVDLPGLPGLSESEVGPLVRRALSPRFEFFFVVLVGRSSWLCRDLVPAVAGIRADGAAQVGGENSKLFEPVLRVDQRGSVSLLRALPDSLRAELNWWHGVR